MGVSVNSLERLTFDLGALKSWLAEARDQRENVVDALGELDRAIERGDSLVDGLSSQVGRLIAKAEGEKKPLSKAKKEQP